MLVIFFISKGLTIVQQSETVIIERLGRYHKTLSSGGNIIMPFIDKARPMTWRYTLQSSKGTPVVRFSSITHIDLRETVYDFARQSVITRDNVVTEINAILYFQIVDPMRAMYEISNLPVAIEMLTQTSLRNVIGEMDLDETLTSRDTINSKLRDILDEATNKWGVKVNRVELQDINPPRDIRDAMEKQMRAERDKRAQILTAEGQKEAVIRESEGKMQQSINHAVESSGADPAQYLIAMRYLEVLGTMGTSKSDKVVYLPFEATGILSAIGGIKDIAGGVKGPLAPLVKEVKNMPPATPKPTTMPVSDHLDF